MKNEDAQSTDSEDEPNRVPLTRLRPNRNRPILCDTTFRSTGRPVRNNRYPLRFSDHQTSFAPRNPPSFRPRNNRTEKVMGKSDFDSFTYCCEIAQPSFYLESSSSEEEEEEEGRKYSLRDRRPKPAPKTSKNWQLYCTICFSLPFLFI